MLSWPPTEGFAALIYSRALKHLKRGEFERAIGRLTQAIRLDPRLAPAFYEPRCGLGSSRGVRQSHRGLHRSNSTRSFGHGLFKVGVSRGSKRGRRTGRLRTAPRQFVSESTTCRSLSQPHGHKWLNKGEVGNALSDFTEAIRLAPQNPEFFHGRSAVWRAMRQYDKAIADCDEAIRLDPAAPHFNNQGLVWNERDYEKAVADCTQAFN